MLSRPEKTLSEKATRDVGRLFVAVPEVVADFGSAWGNRSPNHFETSDFAPVWGGFPFLCAFWRNEVIAVR